MHVHDISIFTCKSMEPKFDSLKGFSGIVLNIHSKEYEEDTRLSIFFEDMQDATNFKNEIAQSWETFLREKENSNG